MSVQESLIPLFYPVRLPEMESAAVDVIRSGQIAAGPKVDAFEKKFQEYSGCTNIVSTNDMTSALIIALKLAGVNAGDEVATLAFSCLSSNSPIAVIGAQAKWIDIDPQNISMCPRDLEKKISSKTKAVLLYHIAGYPAKVDEISAICRAANIPLIEDCNNALGAMFNDQQIGTFGDFSVFSFYPNRQINGLDGGALYCADAGQARQAKKLRRFGVDFSTFRDSRGEINPDSDVECIGYSASFSQLNAAVALSQFPTVSSRQEKVRENARKLTERLSHLKDIQPIPVVENGISAYWGMLVYAEHRDAILMKLKSNGVLASIMHQRNDVYTGFNQINDSLLGTDFVMDKIMALPCGWWLTDENIEKIAETLESAIN